MSELDVRISDRSDPFNSIILEVTRTLDKSESDQLRRLIEQAWDDGYDSCRMERDRQRLDPSYPLHRRNPYRSTP